MAITRAVPQLRRVERLIRPRLSFLGGMPFIALFGLQTLWLALILVLPIPFGNWPPAIATAMLALGMIQRDGVLMLLSIPAAMVATVIALVVGAASILFLREIVQVSQLWWSSLFGG